jgi:hypothetical protein
METTCTRCHQLVPADSCYCPACGLPQLVYSAEGGSPPAAATERWSEAVRDASSIDWKPAMKAALALAIPAGLLSSGISPLSALGIFWMAAASAWAVTLYLRSQRPAWITMGAGARIGLVTGLIAGWLAICASGTGLFVTRVVMHQGEPIDSAWREVVEKVDQQTHQLEAQMSVPEDAAQWNAERALMLSPEGHAGFVVMGLAWYSMLLVLVSMAGGAIGARILARRRRPQA